MKINFMMTIIAVSFFTVTAIMASEIFVQHEAVTAGLQQCKVDNQYVWQKVCN